MTAPPAAPTGSTATPILSKGNMAARRTREKSGIGLNLEWAWCWPVNRQNYLQPGIRGHVRQTLGFGSIRSSWERLVKTVERVMVGGCARRRVAPDVEFGRYAQSQIQIPLYHEARRPRHGSSDPGRADGPFPEHYEPIECPVGKNPFSSSIDQPTAVTYRHPHGYLQDLRPQVSHCGHHLPGL
jgi:formate dehydrogenase major subunit